MRGQVRVINELVTRDMHTEQFAIMLSKYIIKNYPGHRIVMVGDPRGGDLQPNQTDAAMITFKIFRKHNLDIVPAWSTDIRRCDPLAGRRKGSQPDRPRRSIRPKWTGFD